MKFFLDTLTATCHSWKQFHLTIHSVLHTGIYGVLQDLSPRYGGILITMHTLAGSADRKCLIARVLAFKVQLFGARTTMYLYYIFVYLANK